MLVASKVGNRRSKFGQARPYGFSNYWLCTRRTDRQTDGQTKATLTALFFYERGHNNNDDDDDCFLRLR